MLLAWALSNKLSDQNEVDETFVGGKARNIQGDKRDEKIIGTGCKNKAMSSACRKGGGNVIAKV